MKNYDHNDPELVLQEKRAALAQAQREFYNCYSPFSNSEKANLINLAIKELEEAEKKYKK